MEWKIPPCPGDPKAGFSTIPGANPWVDSGHHPHGRVLGETWYLLMLQTPGKPHLNQKGM